MKKMAYRIIFFLLALSLVTSSVYADDLLDKHAPNRNDPSRLRQISRIIAETNAANENIYTPQGGGTESLSVPLRQQQNGFYCGPASVQMVLAYFGYAATQAKLAEDMLTNQLDGTLVWRIASRINSSMGSGQYAFIHTSELSFSSKLLPSINDGYPIVCHTQTNKLPHYNGHSSGHYVVVIGYSWVQGGSSGGQETRVIFNDPNYNDSYYGRHTCTVSQMTSAINANAGYFIAH